MKGGNGGTCEFLAFVEVVPEQGSQTLGLGFWVYCTRQGGSNH